VRWNRNRQRDEARAELRAVCAEIDDYKREVYGPTYRPPDRQI
jgi:hypothetical protein